MQKARPHPYYNIMLLGQRMKNDIIALAGITFYEFVRRIFEIHESGITRANINNQ